VNNIFYSYFIFNFLCMLTEFVEYLIRLCVTYCSQVKAEFNNIKRVAQLVTGCVLDNQVLILDKGKKFCLHHLPDLLWF
jgi:hypothetical protein